MQRFIIILTSVITLSTFSAYSQAISWMIDGEYRPSYAFSSFRDDILRETLQMDNAKITRFASSAHLKCGFKFSPLSKEGKFFPGVWQGIGAGVNMFGNPDGLGTPVSLYVFQGAPILHLNNRLSLYYEWNFGASIGWKSCDGKYARSNLIVGSKVNAYINLGTGLRWKASKDITLSAGIDITHFSNGNTSFPNPGVNMAGVKIGVSHSFGADPDYKIPSYHTDTIDSRSKISYDITAYGSMRKRVYRGGESPLLLKGHFAVGGINFAPMWEVARIFRTGLSLDFQWDESTDLRRHQRGYDANGNLQYSRPPFFSQLSTGLSARAELVMPIFSVNVGIGYNILRPEEQRGSYQLANLKVRLVRGLFVNIGYQLLNFSRQNNLMLGFGYSFR